MRKMLKFLPILLLSLALVAGCSKHAQPPPQAVPAPVQPAKADPAKTIGATNACVSFLSNQLGWVAVNLERQQPSASVILHTGDGGQSWVQLNSPGLSVVQQLDFPDAQHGWALVTANAANNQTSCAIMATTDGGQTWTQQWAEDVQQDGRPYRIQFLDASNGFALIGDTFMATVDGGATWVKRPIAQGMSGFSFSASASGPPLAGWAVGASSIWSTTDGGATWHRQWTIPDKIKGEFPDDGGAVTFVSPNAGWALFQGEGSMFKTAKLVLHTDDGGSNWTITSAFLPPDIQANLPQAPHYTTTCFVPVSAQTALLAASPPTDYPVLYRTNDNGSQWDALSDGMSGVSGLPEGSWGNLSFVNDSEGWAAVIIQTPTQTGSSDTVSNVALLHTLDGGKTWSPQFP
jgi:photosystem II stability/assembly factor-like uncharacterized protein